jgi:hypothetical protein
MSLTPLSFQALSHVPTPHPTSQTDLGPKISLMIGTITLADV